MDDVLNFVEGHRNVYLYLPDKIEVKKCPKQWLVNIVFTVVKDDFSQFGRQQIEARNSKIAIEKDLMIDMDPEVAEAFAASTSISCKYLFRILKWNLYFLLFLLINSKQGHWGQHAQGGLEA